MPDRRTFWPTVLVGSGGAALASVSASRSWATASVEVAGTASEASAKGSESVPLALALSLVALAAWGALLVVRRRARRVVAGIGLLAAVGAVIATASGGSRAKDDAVALLAGNGAGASVGLSGWYTATLVGALLAALSFGYALVKVRSWPEMAARYDAPGSQDRQPDQTDLWKAMDEGHDPTL